MIANVVPDRPRPGSVTVMVAGEIDLTDHDELRTVLVEGAPPPVTSVVVDLTGVTFLGSSGIGALIAAWKELGERDIDLRVDRCSQIADRVLEIAGVRSLLAAPGHPHSPRGPVGVDDGDDDAGDEA